MNQPLLSIKFDKPVDDEAAKRQAQIAARSAINNPDLFGRQDTRGNFLDRSGSDPLFTQIQNAYTAAGQTIPPDMEADLLRLNEVSRIRQDVQSVPPAIRRQARLSGNPYFDLFRANDEARSLTASLMERARGVLTEDTRLRLEQQRNNTSLSGINLERGQIALDIDQSTKAADIAKAKAESNTAIANSFIAGSEARVQLAGEPEQIEQERIQTKTERQALRKATRDADAANSRAETAAVDAIVAEATKNFNINVDKQRSIAAEIRTSIAEIDKDKAGTERDTAVVNQDRARTQAGNAIDIARRNKSLADVQDLSAPDQVASARQERINKELTARLRREGIEEAQIQTAIALATKDPKISKARDEATAAAKRLEELEASIAKAQADAKTAGVKSEIAEDTQAEVTKKPGLDNEKTQAEINKLNTQIPAIKAKSEADIAQANAEAAKARAAKVISDRESAVEAARQVGLTKGNSWLQQQLQTRGLLTPEQVEGYQQALNFNNDAAKLDGQARAAQAKATNDEIDVERNLAYNIIQRNNGRIPDETSPADIIRDWNNVAPEARRAAGLAVGDEDAERKAARQEAAIQLQRDIVEEIQLDGKLSDATRAQAVQSSIENIYSTEQAGEFITRLRERYGDEGVPVPTPEGFTPVRIPISDFENAITAQLTEQRSSALALRQADANLAVADTAIAALEEKEVSLASSGVILGPSFYAQSEALKQEALISPEKAVESVARLDQLIDDAVGDYAEGQAKAIDGDNATLDTFSIAAEAALQKATGRLEQNGAVEQVGWMEWLANPDKDTDYGSTITSSLYQAAIGDDSFTFTSDARDTFDSLLSDPSKSNAQKMTEITEKLFEDGTKRRETYLRVKATMDTHMLPPMYTALGNSLERELQTSGLPQKYVDLARTYVVDEFRRTSDPNKIPRILQAYALIEDRALAAANEEAALGPAANALIENPDAFKGVMRGAFQRMSVPKVGDAGGSAGPAPLGVLRQMTGSPAFGMKVLLAEGLGTNPFGQHTDTLDGQIARHYTNQLNQKISAYTLDSGNFTSDVPAIIRNAAGDEEIQQQERVLNSLTLGETLTTAQEQSIRNAGRNADLVLDNALNNLVNENEFQGRR